MINFILDPVAVRVLGCLMEKEVTTPDYYPMSLNALLNACNQKSNREPVMQLSEYEVELEIDTLKEKHLLWLRSVSGARVSKYEHNIKSIIPLTDPEFAVFCVLMLRGAQTIGEIRSRCERLYKFPSINEAQQVVQQLMARDDGAVVKELARQPGRKELRYIHLLCGESWALEQGGDTSGADISGREECCGDGAAATVVTSPSERIRILEASVENLKTDYSLLREEFDALKAELE